MSTLYKILVGIVAAALLIFTVLAVAVAVLFEPDDYRPYLVSAVERATGRDFALSGDLGLKLFPCCGVSVGTATLGNPEGFPEGAFASIESATLSLKIWPLIARREVQIGTVTLDGLDVRLLRLADGRGNWEFAEGAAEQAPAPEAGSSVASLTIDGLVARNGKVVFTDQAAGTSYTASDIRVDAGALGTDAPVPVSLSLSATDAGGMTATLALDTVAQVVGSAIRLQAPRLSVDVAGDAIPGGQARAEVNAADIGYDTESSVATMSALTADLMLTGTCVHLTGEARAGADSTTASGTFEVKEGSPRQLLEAMPDPGYLPADAKALDRLSGTGNWALTATSLSLRDLRLQLDDTAITGSGAVTDFERGALSFDLGFDLGLDRLDVDRYLPAGGGQPAAASVAAAEPTVVPFATLRALPVKGNLKVQQLRVSGIDVTALQADLTNDAAATKLNVTGQLLGGRLTLNGAGNPSAEEPALSGRLELQGVSPRAALSALGEAPATADPAALSSLSGSTRWRLGSRSLDLEQMSWQLDSTRLTGKLGINDFDEPAARFELALDSMDLDGYLAPDQGDAGSAATTDTEIPVELIRGLDLAGHLTAGALSVAGLRLQNLDAGVTASNGVLRLEPLRADLYGGTYQGSIRIDATGPRAQLSLDQQISAVQVGDLLNSLVGAQNLVGSVSMQLKGNGSGNTQSELLKALGGDFSFKLSDGVYRGMDIAYEIQNAQSMLKREPPPDRPNLKETPIKALAFSGSIVDGVFGSDNLTAEIPYLRLAGKGGVNLIERTLDYKLDARVVKAADAAGAASRLQELANSVIPLTIKGPLTEPKVRVDLQGLITETVKEKARDVLLKKLLGAPEAPAAPTPSATEAAPAAAQDNRTAPDAGSASAAARAQTEQTPPASAQTPAAPAPAAETEQTPTTEPEQKQEEPSPKDLLKRSLRDLLKKPE
ncbi:MAG: AsmA family protein [Pseudomonadales bacterium]